jgi:hypothetical protein
MQKHSLVSTEPASNKKIARFTVASLIVAVSFVYGLQVFSDMISSAM